MSQITQTSRRIYCRNNCGVEITFDSRKAPSGKSIPIDIGSGMPHKCPNSSYAQYQQPRQEPQVTVVKQQEQRKTLTVDEKLDLIISKLDKVISHIEKGV